MIRVLLIGGSHDVYARNIINEINNGMVQDELT